MRQGQQNRRGRGRNNNNNNNNNNNSNRKSQNPLARSFESAGPDVKIRGTPSHIAEKYIALARDAQSSGDPVLAENYLQHAEHYNRIILTYREQQVSQGADPFSGGTLARTHSLGGQEGGDGDEFSDEDGGEDIGGGQGQPLAASGEGGQPQQPQQPPFQQQPRSFEGQQRYDNRPHRQDNRGDHRPNNNRNDHQRFDRHDRGDRPDFRNDRNDRPNGNSGGDNRGFRDDRRFDRQPGEGQPQGDGQGFRRRDRFQGQGGGHQGGGNGAPPGFDRDAAPQPSGFQPAVQPPMPAPSAAPPPVTTPEQEQPAFLRRPVRRPRREETEAAPVPRAPVVDDQD